MVVSPRASPRLEEADALVELVARRTPASLDEAGVRGAVDALLKAADASGSRVRGDIMEVAQGSWEVVHAPHIHKLSSPFAVGVETIRYVVRGTSIASNVRLCPPLVRPVWLSAQGSFEASGPDECRVLFDKFWVDAAPSGTLREFAPALQEGLGPLALAERFVDQTGRAAFFPALSRFPVIYMDDRCAIFRFPPLRSNIVIVRVDAESTGEDEGVGGKAAGVAVGEVKVNAREDDSVDMLDAASAAEAVRGKQRGSWGGDRSRRGRRGRVAAPEENTPPAVVEADEIREPPSSAGSGGGRVAAIAPAPVPGWEAMSLGGVWKRDGARSGDDKGLLDLMEMNALFRQAYGLLDTLELTQSASELRLSTRALIITLDEVYPTTGAKVPQRRRDLRSGACSGAARVVAKAGADGGAAAELTLDAEGDKACRQVELLYTTNGGKVVVRELELSRVQGGSFSGVTYYTRKQ